MNNPIFYIPPRPTTILAKTKMGSKHPPAGRKKPFLPSTIQIHHRSQQAEYARLLSGVDLVEVVDLTDSNGVDSPEAKQQPANSNIAGVGDKDIRAEKRDGDDVRSVQDAVADKEWDDSLVDPDSNAPETSHIDRSGTERQVSALALTTVGDRDNLIRDNSRRDEGSGTSSNLLDPQPHPLNATAGEQDHHLTDTAHQTDSNHSTKEPHPNPNNTTIHAIAVNSSGQTTHGQPPIPGSISGGDEDMDKQTQPSPPVTGSTERALEELVYGPLEHGTDAVLEPARSSQTDLGRLDSSSKPTDPLDFFLPGSPAEAATEDSSPVTSIDSSQGEGHGATPKDVSAIEVNSQQVQEHFLVPSPSSKESKAALFGKLDNKTIDYVSRLSQEQRDHYAPLNDERWLTTPPQPPQDKHHVYEQPRRGVRKRKAEPRVPASDKSVKRNRLLAKATALPFPAGSKSSSPSPGRARVNTRADQRNDGPPPVDTKNNRYAVECLLARRVRQLRGGKGQVNQYKVRWEGYGPGDDQWRDEGDIDPPLIQAYHASTRSADAKVGATVAADEGERASDDSSGASDDDHGAEPVQHCRTQHFSRAGTRRLWKKADELRLLKYRREGMSWEWICSQFPDRTEGAIRTRVHMLQWS